MENLQDAIEYTSKALSQTPDGHPEKPTYFNKLGLLFGDRYTRLGSLESFNHALSIQCKSVDLIPDDHPNKAAYLGNLADLLRDRFRRLGRSEDLEATISYQTKAVELTPDDHPNKPVSLNSLGGLIRDRFRFLGRLEDREDTITNHMEPIHLTRDDHGSNAVSHDTLAGSMQERLAYDNGLEDGADISEEFGDIKLTRDDQSADLDDRLDSVKGLSDLEAAISFQRKAVQLTQEGEPNRPTYLNELALSLMARFRCRRDVNDRNEGISILEVVDKVVPDGHPIKPAFLNNLADSLREVNPTRALETYERADTSLDSAPVDAIHAAKKWARLAFSLAHSDSDFKSSLKGYDRAVKLLPRVVWCGCPRSRKGIDGVRQPRA